MINSTLFSCYIFQCRERESSGQQWVDEIKKKPGSPIPKLIAHSLSLKRHIYCTIILQSELKAQITYFHSRV